MNFIIYGLPSLIHPEIFEDETSKGPRTQLALDIKLNRARFPDCILLTRVGQFYEVHSTSRLDYWSLTIVFISIKSYFDQATEVARLLGIKLASRSWGGSRVHMCGFPLGHLDRHLKVLVPQRKRFVALCEEFKVPDGFERRVVRIVTPGTLIDESFLDHYENNYLVAISMGGSDSIGLAWIDVSTGEFFSQSSTIGELRDDLARISPKEVVLEKSLKSDKDHPLHRILGVDFASTTSYASFECDLPPERPIIDGTPTFISGGSYGPDEMAAIRLLTSFLKTHLLEIMPELPVPVHQSVETRMQIDSHTIAGLEIKRVMDGGGVKGSLLSTIKRTVTSGGTRLLSRWLCDLYLPPKR